MVYITGDTHRDFARVEEFCEEYGTTEDDILIILGDVGINYYLDDRDDEIKRGIEPASNHIALYTWQPRGTS